MRRRLAVLGDSIAWGQGAASARERLAPVLSERLTARGLAVEARVLARRGARSRQLHAQVDRALPWEPDLALIVIGANDLTHLEPVETAVAALEVAVRRLRAVDTEVVVAPAPDLSAVPHVPVAMRDVVRAAGDHFRFQQVAAVTAAGGRVADPDQRASRAFATDPTLFSSDRFHPSSAGYAVIADALYPAVSEALAASPAHRSGKHGSRRMRATVSAR